MILSAILVPFLLAPCADGEGIAAVEQRVRSSIAEGDWRVALAGAEACRRVAPEAPRARAILAEALYRAGRFRELDGLLDGVAAEPAAPARALMTLGRLRDAQGRSGEAVALMRRALQAAPEDTELLYHAAGATETREEAAALLERYLERSEAEPEDRVTAARGQLRLLRALGERAVWVSTSRPERAVLPLRPLWVPETGQVVGHLIEVELGPKARRVKLLLDSGSPGLFLIERIARKREFEPLAELTVFGGGGDGRHSTTRGFFSRFGLGGLAFTDALASIGRDELDPQGRYHGLLGLSVFHGYRVTLDLRRKRLRLEPGGTELAGGTPYYTVGGQMLVEAGTRDGTRGLFLFDTGSTNTLLASSLAARLEGATVGGSVELPAYGGAREGARSLRGVEIDFQGLDGRLPALRAVDLSLRSRMGGVEISGFLGLDLLGGRTIEIDTVRRLLRVRD